MGLKQQSYFLSSRRTETFFLARYQCKHFHSGWKESYHTEYQNVQIQNQMLLKKFLFPFPQYIIMQFRKEGLEERNWTWSRQRQEKITTSLNNISFLKPQKSKPVQNRPQFHSSLLLYIFNTLITHLQIHKNWRLVYFYPQMLNGIH